MIERILNYQFSLFKFQFSGKSLIKNPLFAGSAVMVFGSNVANFIAYLYHLFIGRLLGPSSYGELAATLASLGLFSTAFVFFGLVIVKFVSASKKHEKQLLYSWFLRRALYVGVFFLLIFIAVAPLVSNFIHIETKIALLIGPILFSFLLSFLFRSFLQGLLKFTQTVLVTVVDISLRLIFGLLLVFLGFSAFGAVVGILLGSILSIFIALYFLREFRWKKAENGVVYKKGKKILRYAMPVLLVSIANNSFISSDVILAKHYFDPHDAGIYASLSVLGKIIFYGTAPVTAVMFPMISQRKTRGQKFKNILNLSLLMTLGVAGGVLLIYYFLPELMVKILFGSRFLDAASNLVLFGLFMAIYTVANLFVSFYLSLERTRVVVFPLVFAIFQIVGITLYHDSILTVIKVSILSALLLLFCLLVFFGYEKKTLFAKTKR